MTPQARRLLRYFDYGHLPTPLAEVSSLFHALALTVAQQDAIDGAEQTVALRKLLEAKDAAVRSLIPES